MRDPARIGPFCDRLKAAWMTVLEWRFGQLMSNVLGAMAASGKDPFFVEDDEMFEYIDEYLSGTLTGEQDDVVHFEHYGVKYTMTAQEIEAAYRHRLHQYRLEDAVIHLNTFIFGYDDGSDDFLNDPKFAEARDGFCSQYGISYEEALSEPMLELYVERFDDRFDCNRSENAVWEEAISGALS